MSRSRANYAVNPARRSPERGAPPRLRRLWRFYRDGFRQMRLGRTLWRLIFIKVAVLTALGLWLFPDRLDETCDTDEQRAERVLDALTPQPPSQPASESARPRPAARPLIPQEVSK